MTLRKGKYVPRLVDSTISELLQVNGALSVEGTKYCGKTWASMAHANSMFALDDPSNNYRNLNLARMDASYALEGSSPHLIDEWQLVPGVWDGVRRRVDDEGKKGMFILSGSSTPNSCTGTVFEVNPDLAPIHSGYGRIAPVHMRTMSLFESGKSTGDVSLKGLFESEFRNTPANDVNLERIIGLVLRGGWPGNLDLDDSMAARAVSALPDEICRRDVLRIDPSKDPSRMLRVIRSLARNESTLASNKVLSRDIREYDDDVLKDDTVSCYVDVLRRLYLVEDQPAFNPNLRSSVRVGKSPKRHLTDPALSAAALGLTQKTLLDDLETFGFLFEAMCERDLQIYAYVNGGSLCHYRDLRGREIDAVVEMPGRRWGAFEIKLGTNQIDSAAENLLRIDSLIRDDPEGRPPEFLCVICGLAGAAYRREDGVYVVPITSLRN